MKKQTTALVLSLFIVLVLTGVMVFLMVRFRSGEEQQESSSSAQTQEDALLALSSNQINTVTITNPDDSFTLVNQGNGFVVEGLEEIAVSNLNVSNLLSYFQRLEAFCGQSGMAERRGCFRRKGLLSAAGIFPVQRRSLLQ